MKCRCGGDTFVTDSRAGELNTIRRRRQCESCGKRFTSWESTTRPDFRDRSAYFAKRYREMDPTARALLKKRRAVRHAAKKEAEATGRPFEDICKEWGVS